MSRPLITVIVPAYNVEKYIIRCLKSIEEQSYDNLEIIVVDDGSKDHTGERIDRFAKTDSRFKVIHQKNKGISGARNIGIEEAKGDYVLFVDSDDFIAQDHVEHLYKILTKEKADISISGHQKFYKEQEIQKDGEPSLEVMSGMEAMESLLYRKKFTTSPWGKLYRRTLFEGIQYPLGKIYEDLATTYRVLAKANKVVISTARNYYYFQRMDSIFHTQFQKKNLVLLEISEGILENVRTYYPQCENAAKSRYFISCIQLYRMMTKEPETRDIYNKVRSGIKCCRKTVLADKKAKISTRFMALIACMNVSLLRFMGKVHTAGIRLFHVRVKY